MKNVYLFQPQYQNQYNNVTHYWFPYSAACLWAYATLFPEITSHFRLAEIQFKREKQDDVISRMEDPAYCGFSVYLWNEQYCLALAKKVKEKWPDCHISFGGPQAGADYFKYNYVDSVVFAEGEQSFVDSLIAIKNNETPLKIYDKKRMDKLDDVPSPYLLGIFDQMVADNPEVCWNSVLETNRGCPFQCTFCDWGGVTYGKIKRFGLEKIDEELLWMANNNVATIFIADANFGIFKERDFEIAKLIKKHSLLPNSKLNYVNITYTKNSNEDVFKIAKELHPLTKSVTVSMQSMSEETLEHIKRKNMKSNNLTEIMGYSKKYDIPTYTEMILGLPQETVESWKTGLSQLIEYGQHNQIDVFIALLIKNSELAQFNSRLQYGIKSIVTENYILYASDDADTEEDSDYAETSEIVVGTSSMGLEDMIEAYMYSWVITNFHTSGYSQIIAKYLRYVKNISYREFYDRFFNYIKENDTVVNDDYNTMHTAIRELLTIGNIVSVPIKANHIAFYSYVPFFFNKDKIIDLSIKVARTFGELDESIIEIQKNFMYQTAESFPFELHSNYDIDTWEEKNTTYSVSTHLKDFVPDYYHISLQRRRGYLKNVFTPVHK